MNWYASLRSINGNPYKAPRWRHFGTGPRSGPAPATHSRGSEYEFSVKRDHTPARGARERGSGRGTWMNRVYWLRRITTSSRLASSPVLASAAEAGVAQASPTRVAVTDALPVAFPRAVRPSAWAISVLQ